MLSTISTRVDCKDKKAFESLCEDLGLNVSVAINIYIKQAIKKQAIPVSLELVDERKKIDFSKYSAGNSMFKSEKEIEEYMREMREDR